MKAIATPRTPDLIKHPSGNEDQHLPARVIPHAGPAGIVPPGDAGYHLPVILSVWAPDPLERAALSAGGYVELAIWGARQPPVSVGVTTDTIEQGLIPGPSLWLEADAALAQDLQRLIERSDLSPSSPATRSRLEELHHYLARGLDELERLAAQGPPK